MQTLLTFVNKHLNKLNLEVSELDTQVTSDQTPSIQCQRIYNALYIYIHHFLYNRQFADGVYMVLLMGLLEGYFVPLYNFFLTPDNFDHKVLL